MASTLRESPLFSQISSPLASASSSSSDAYILFLASLPDHYAAAVSAPTNIIDLFDKSTLQGIQTLPGHNNATTSLKSVVGILGHPGPSLISSGRDGCVKLWDQRSNTHGIQMMDPGRNRPLLCCDVSMDGGTVAAGTALSGDDAFILFWDPRKPSAPLRTHGSTHSDDVTTVAFCGNSSSPHILLSASSDGLISISNAEEDDEDEAVLHVGNWGCSISQAGWYGGATLRGLWAASDMETFSTWSTELDQQHNIDIRSPSLHNHGYTWVTDYLITCQQSSGSESELGIFVGSNEGDVALLSNSDLTTSDAPWFIQTSWINGHIGVVRSLLWDSKSNILLTGGEDSKINLWPSFPQSTTPEGQGDDSMDIGWGGLKRGPDEGEGKTGKRARR
ncbi:WD40 repeat-like protein [Infundibulicybe gibba]|nr:WD40 repeat-like protein [Infundibulicybe gibba]